MNAMEIAKLAGSLHDKFVGFLGDMEKIEKSIQSAQGAYHDARSKLAEGKDNLVRKVERIKELGAKATKDIPDSYLE
jgi:DNA recombination protein RmuC